MTKEHSVWKQQLLNMEKGRAIAVYLTPRDSVAVKNVDWDCLVDDVFKEEVDQFVIETGMQSLNIENHTNSLFRSETSKSETQRWSPFRSTSPAISASQFSTSRQN